MRLIISWKLIFTFFVIWAFCFIGEATNLSKNEAYVTLLYGDEFLLGVRVLGKSIRDSGSNKDMVALVSDGVSEYANNLIQIEHFDNENQNGQSFLNGGSNNYLECEGDQGFLNSYYASFPNAHLFEPDLPSDILNSRTVPAMERLSTLYNADVGLYMLANKWMVDERELRVIHYTLGPIKPWDWWTSWLLKPVDVWQKVRVQLGESLPGTEGGKNPNDELLVKFLFLIPLVVLQFCYYRSFLQTRSVGDHIRHLFYICRTGGVFGYSSISSSISSNQQLPNGVQIPAFLGCISVLVCFIVALVSLGISLSIIPRQVMPWTGLLLMYEWTYTLFFLLFGSYLHLIYRWGRHVGHNVGSISSSAEPADYDFGKGHIREVSCCDISRWHYGVGLGSVAVVAPALPCIFGVTALFLRLALMIFGGLVLTSFMTYASQHLAIKSFKRGFED
ncbi:glycosyltransferase [Lithospermum erythrorhizon]|uniref:Glycosyltransferase n=1 Tax=Lithospermum erythrorhizon TaxID=34254 RepID=A0AAV3R2J2_LITER